jgi:hypothetical protein
MVAIEARLECAVQKAGYDTDAQVSNDAYGCSVHGVVVVDAER